jgi:hypothetical protein
MTAFESCLIYYKIKKLVESVLMVRDVALWNLETGSALKEMLWLIRKYVWYKHDNNKIPNSGVVKAGNTSANQKTVRH